MDMWDETLHMELLKNIKCVSVEDMFKIF